MEIVRSHRRRRTGSAAVRDDQLVVRVPAGLSAADERRLVDGLVDRLRRRARNVPGPVPGVPDAVAPRPTTTAPGPRGDAWLAGFADEVGVRWLDGERASSVRWSARMTSRWASCTVPSRRIRVSDRLADAPDVVVGNILLHELAHLRERGHGAAFRALLARDPATAAVASWLARREGLEVARVLRREGLLEPG